VNPDDVAWMRLALAEARVAASRGEVPVGCVLVGPDGQLVARAHNLRETLQDPTGHAELMALRWAAMDRGVWRLSGVTAYVTLEPCPMCAGALVNSRVARVVYGCDDPKAGAVRTLFAIGQDPRLNHRFEVTAGVLGEECADVLRSFFAALRAKSRGRAAAEK
jgi:tRNA(adenine34) deaminase